MLTRKISPFDIPPSVPPARSLRRTIAPALLCSISSCALDPLRVAVVKPSPISTVPKALDTIDVATGQAAKAINQRSDVCAVPAAGVVGEAMAALVLAEAVLEKFGGDSVAETKRNFESYMAHLRFK